MAQYQSTVLSDIKLDDVSLAGFDSHKTKYVVSITNNPSSIDAVSPASNIIAEKVIDTSNHVRFTVSNTFNSETITYDLYFHYTNDIIPNGEFTQWTTAKYNSGPKPVGWKVPADAVEKSNTGWEWMWGTAKTGSEVANSSNQAARLKTTYWAVLAGTIPSVMTIGDISCELKVAIGSTTNFSGGITFRNTPDFAAIRYNFVKK